MRRLLTLTLAALAMANLCLAAEKPAATGAQCPAGSSQRLSFYNNFAEDGYIILTPPSADDTTQLWPKTGSFTKLGTADTQYITPIKKGETVDLCIPDAGIASGKFKFYFGCNGKFDKDTKYPKECKIGVEPGHIPFGVDSVFEFTGGCKPSDGNNQIVCTKNPSDTTQDLGPADYADLGNVDGYTISMQLDMASGNSEDHQCNFTTMKSIVDLYSCPKEDSTTIDNSTYKNPQLDTGISLVLTDGHKDRRVACMAPERWLMPPGGEDPQGPHNTKTVTIHGGITSETPNISDWYGCNVMPYKGADTDPDKCLTPGCGGPQCAAGPLTPGKYDMASVAAGKGKPYTNYVKLLKATGNQAYAWQFNDDASTMVCQKWGGKFLVTLGPGPEKNVPIPGASQKWAFDKGRNECNVSSSGSYDTLVACQQANMKYTCATEVVQKKKPDDTYVQAKLNYCVPVTGPAKAGSGGEEPVTWDLCVKSSCQSTGKLKAGNL